VTQPDSSGTTTYLYEGNTVKITDPANKWKKFTYDAFGNLVQVTEPNPAGGSNYQAYYAYL
jgi:YD repeat-containing protein